MADKKISEFTPITTYSPDDIMLINHEGVTNTIKLSSFAENVNKIVAESKTIYSESGKVSFFGKPRGSHLSTALVATKDNKVLTWGYNYYMTDRWGYSVPPENATYLRFWGTNNEDYLLANPTAKIIDLQYNTYFYMALLSDGTVWCCGYDSGYMGTGSVSNKRTYGFVKLSFPTGVKIKSISMTGDNSLELITGAAISDTNDLYTWGYNVKGQLGLGDTTATNTPTKINTAGLVGNVKQVLCSNPQLGNIIVLDLAGNVWGSGYNGNGALGQGTTADINYFRKVKVDATNYLTDVRELADSSWGQVSNVYVIKNDGTLWGAGYNGYYNLADGTTTPSVYFKRIGTLSGVKEILASGYTTYASTQIVLLNNGDVYTWGYNGYGQCGTGNTTNVQTPTKIASGATKIFNHTGFNSAGVTGYLKDKKIYLSGHRAFTSLSENDDTQTRHYPQHINNVVDVLFGNGGGSPHGNHESTLALTENGVVYGWGVNEWYFLGGSVQHTYNPRILIK